MGLEYDFSELEQKLLEMDRKVAKQMTDVVLQKAAKPLLEEQKKLVPKDTRKLHDALIVDKPRGIKNKKIKIGIDPSKAKDVVYGFYQEYGTSRMVGKKWMKRSWQNKNKEARNIIKKEIVRIITS